MISDRVCLGEILLPINKVTSSQSSAPKHINMPTLEEHSKNSRELKGLIIPTIDIDQYDTVADARPEILRLIRSACIDKGFFLITGHGISKHLHTEIFKHSKSFFSQPLHEKLEVDEKKGWGKSHRGYQIIGGEAYEEGTLPDLKEVGFSFYWEIRSLLTCPQGFQYGNHKELNHPDVAAERVMCGPNQWPKRLPGFREAMEEYLEKVSALAIRVLKLLAETLEVNYEEVLGPFSHDAAMAVRLLHYPPQPDNADEKQLGTGAHTDL